MELGEAKNERWKKFAYNLLDYSINLNRGDHILIGMMGEDANPLGKELISQSEK